MNPLQRVRSDRTHAVRPTVMFIRNHLIEQYRNGADLDRVFSFRADDREEWELDTIVEMLQFQGWEAMHKAKTISVRARTEAVKSSMESKELSIIERLSLSLNMSSSEL